MSDINLRLSETATLHLQVEDGRVAIARLIIMGMPMQPRGNFGGMYPSSEAIRKGLAFYGYQFQEWADSENSNILEKLRGVGIFPETWFQENIIQKYYPEEDLTSE